MKKNEHIFKIISTGYLAHINGVSSISECIICGQSSLDINRYNISCYSDEAILQREKESHDYSIFRLIFEYIRFIDNWSTPFTAEGWHHIRGKSSPSYKEVNKIRKQYKLDNLSKEIIKEILWDPKMSSRINIEKNKISINEI